MIETIENDWNALFRDYPEVYDEFARVEMKPTLVEAVHRFIPLEGKTVVDVGSGTGIPTLQMAEYAASVIGVEPESSMRAVAEKHAREKALANVKFVDGLAENLPLPDASVDVVLAITLQTLFTEENIRSFVMQAQRVSRPGGTIATVNIAPLWYGGELGPIIYKGPRKMMTGEGERDKYFAELGFGYHDFDSLHCYGSVEKALKTYGFIFGRHVIEYIKEHKTTEITFRYRMHYKTLE